MSSRRSGSVAASENVNKGLRRYMTLEEKVDFFYIASGVGLMLYRKGVMVA